MEQREVFFSEEQMSQTLCNFYRTAAEALGYKENEKTRYDCSRIMVSAHVQDAIITSYQAASPEISTKEVIVHLTIAGSKVAENLEENEVALQEGFVSTKNDRKEDENE